MELMDAIMARRSVRSYTNEPVERAEIERLLRAAVQAPSAMNLQPWVFGVIQGKETVSDYSARAKAHLVDNMDRFPGLERYRDMLADPDYALFYGAPALVVIYARPIGPSAAGDCCLAAQNLMLAACDMGLGTCWIGFAVPFLEQPDVKAELGVPAEYRAVAPIVVGRPAGPMPPVPRNPPEVLYWR